MHQEFESTSLSFNVRSKIDDRKLKKAVTLVLRLLIAGLIFRITVATFSTFRPLQIVYSTLSAALLNLARFPAVRDGVYIFLGDWFRITLDCTGWKSVFAMVGLFFASKSYQLRTITLGIFAVLIMNLLRIVSVIILDFTGIVSFQISHGIFWRWGLTSFVFLYWIKFADKKWTENTFFEKF